MLFVGAVAGRGAGVETRMAVATNGSKPPSQLSHRTEPTSSAQLVVSLSMTSDMAVRRQAGVPITERMPSAHWYSLGVWEKGGGIRWTMTIKDL